MLQKGLHGTQRKEARPFASALNYSQVVAGRVFLLTKSSFRLSRLTSISRAYFVRTSARDLESRESLAQAARMANLEQLAILRRGVEAWNAWRESSGDIEPDLEEADLSGFELRGAHLYKARLSRSNLRRADLRAAFLRKAVLDEADLSHADLPKQISVGLRSTKPI